MSNPYRYMYTIYTAELAANHCECLTHGWDHVDGSGQMSVAFVVLVEVAVWMLTLRCKILGNGHFAHFITTYKALFVSLLL